MIYISKGSLWDLLGADALNFAGWLVSADPQAAVLKSMLENTEGLTLDSPLIQGQLIPLLQGKGILSPATVTNINNYIATGNSSIKTYSVLIPEGISDYLEWLKQYCNAPYEVSVGGVYLTVKTRGTCNAPNTEQV